MRRNSVKEQISFSRLPDVCGIGFMNHFVAVGRILYLKTDTESGIGPDLLINDSARFLCRKNHMNTEASSDTRHTDEVFHNFRLFFLQLRKLVHNDK